MKPDKQDIQRTIEFLEEEQQEIATRFLQGSVLLHNYYTESLRKSRERVIAWLEEQLND